MRRGFFKRNYSLCKKFLYESKWQIVFVLGIFSIFFIIGFVCPIFFREEIFSFIQELMLSIEGKGTFEMIVLILLNNLKASFFAVILGIVFGILPMIVAITNGYLLGFVSNEAVSRGGPFALWQLLPHGIFELPAVIFSIGIGVKIGSDLFRKDKKIKHNYIEGIRFFIFVVLPLLVVAAIIEGVLIGILN